MLPETSTPPAGQARVTQPSIDGTYPTMPCRKRPVRSHSNHQKGAARFRKEAASAVSNLVQVAPFDEGDQFIPFGMREPDCVCVLADSDPLVGDLDLGALRAKRAKGELDGFHLDILLDGQVKNPTVRSRYGCKMDFSCRTSTLRRASFRAG